MQLTRSRALQASVVVVAALIMGAELFELDANANRRDLARVAKRQTARTVSELDVLPARLRRLPTISIGSGLVVGNAGTRGRTRIRGLIGVERLPSNWGLLIPNCRSIHTFGMRFALDLVWVGGDGRVVQVDHAIGSRRVRTVRKAKSVVEVSAGNGQRFADAVSRSQKL